MTLRRLRSLWPHLRRSPWGLGMLMVVAYVVSRLPGLTALPVFADEAIYIRWAQLWRHDSAFLFFSLNDGKPPLFFWILGLVLALPGDPLWLARMVSVAVGAATLVILDRIVVWLQGNGGMARVASATIVLLAPWWFFHHRMALVDAFLSFLLALAWLGTLMVVHGRTRRTVAAGVMTVAIGFGGALLTKTPALFAIPILALWSLPSLSSMRAGSWSQQSRRAVLVAVGGLAGTLLFALLKLHPAFGSLFARSSDFSFTLTEVLDGAWRTSIDNVGRMVAWAGASLRPEVVALAAMAPLLSRHKRRALALVLSALIFAAPLLIFGRTLHPRYFLPMAPFLTVGAALFFAEAYRLARVNRDAQLLLTAITLMFVIACLRFQLLSVWTPNLTPFVLADRAQYLTSWSSGHGIREVRDWLRARAARGEYTVVVTEGSFGTLPDGLLLYFDNDPAIAQLQIEGLAQYPVKFLPDWVWDKAANQETWLLVNEDRREIALDHLELLARYPRPYGAPDLLLYRVQPKTESAP